MLVAIMAGLIAGGSLAFGLEHGDTSFKSQIEFEKAFDLTVICSVPKLALAGEKFRKRFSLFALTFFFLTWISTICFAVVFFSKEGKILSPYLQFLQ